MKEIKTNKSTNNYNRQPMSQEQAGKPEARGLSSKEKLAVLGLAAVTVAAGYGMFRGSGKASAEKPGGAATAIEQVVDRFGETDPEVTKVFLEDEARFRSDPSVLNGALGNNLIAQADFGPGNNLEILNPDYARIIEGTVAPGLWVGVDTESVIDSAQLEKISLEQETITSDEAAEFINGIDRLVGKLQSIADEHPVLFVSLQRAEVERG